MAAIYDHQQLDVYQAGFKLAMEIYSITKSFPPEERYSLTDQIRRSSRGVCSNLAEVWRKRRYEAAFMAKLSDSEAEAAETQTWLDFARECRYIEDSNHQQLCQHYDQVIGKLVTMIRNPNPWILK
jgi:four helix bundle protein